MMLSDGMSGLHLPTGFLDLSKRSLGKGVSTLNNKLSNTVCNVVVCVKAQWIPFEDVGHGAHSREVTERHDSRQCLRCMRGM